MLQRTVDLFGILGTQPLRQFACGLSALVRVALQQLQPGGRRRCATGLGVQQLFKTSLIHRRDVGINFAGQRIEGLAIARAVGKQTAQASAGALVFS